MAFLLSKLFKIISMILLAIMILVWVFAISYGSIDKWQHDHDRMAWAKDNPVAAMKEGYVPSDVEVVARLGPRTEVDENGQTCFTKHCPGGYATLSDYRATHPN